MHAMFINKYSSLPTQVIIILTDTQSVVVVHAKISTSRESYYSFIIEKAFK